MITARYTRIGGVSLMDEYGVEKFKVRRTVGKAIVFIVAFGIFIPIGAAVYFLVDKTAGLAMALFGAVPQIFFILTVRAPGSSYGIGTNELLIKKGLSKRTIRFADLKAVKVLSVDETKSILNNYLEPTVQSERNLDLKSWYQSNKKYAAFTRYCTVPIVQQTTAAGHTRNITKFAVRTSGDFVMLRLVDGDELLISPEDAHGLVNRLRSTAPIDGSITIDPRSAQGRKVVPREDKKKKKAWAVYRAVGFVLVAAVAVTIYMTRRPAEERVVPAPLPVADDAAVDVEEPAPPTPVALETGWLDGNTFRIVVEARLTNTFLTEADARQKDLRRLVDFYYAHDTVSALAIAYAEQHDLTLSEDDYSAVLNSLLAPISELSVVVMSEEFSKDNATLVSALDLGRDGLRLRMEELLSVALQEGS
jgi:hypothetical protein